MYVGHGDGQWTEPQVKDLQTGEWFNIEVAGQFPTGNWSSHEVFMSLRLFKDMLQVGEALLFVGDPLVAD